VPEAAEAATHQEDDNQGDKQDAHQAHSTRPIVTAAVSIKPTSAEEQNQQDNQKQHTNQSSYLFEPF
jgi:hypothetical protein